MKVALIGLIESGKSTLLGAISGRRSPPSGAASIEEAIVKVPDERLNWLTVLYKAKKTVYATIDCLDVPGFSFADERGRAAARRLINQIRTAELLVLVVRAFEDPSIAAYRGTVDPARDLADLRTELLLSDLELVATRIEKLEEQVTKPTKTQAQDKAELELYRRLQEAIEAEKAVRSVVKSDAELEVVKSLGFLTLKPVVVVVNVGEKQLQRDFKFNLAGPIPVVSVCAKLEYELSQLDPDSRAEFMRDMGVAEPAVARFVRSCYSALGLISFITVVSGEVRAWPIKEGTCALDAASKVHTDMKRGFIKAETITFEDLKSYGDERSVKAAGRIRLEGKDYIVRDGDVINFRFNV